MHDDPTLPLKDEQRNLAGLASSPQAGETPTLWGPFKLLARVGHGGFGEVYRAWDPTLEREVALKLLLPGTAGAGQSEQEYKAMLREARALAAIQHPNIVHVYGIDRHDGRVGFWTDFVKGKTLSSLLGAQGSFGYREAANIGLDITRALSAVHRAGILHRDIKAENVMREEGGRILLMDFGLSTLPQHQTHVAGTPSYIAPELWHGDPATVQSDIYAIGVLLFHLVTGEYPVALGGLSSEQAVAALKNRRTLLDLRSDLPESFLRTVTTATETDPAKRFASAGQLAAALSESLGTPAPLEPSAAITPAASAISGWRKNLPLKLFAACLVLAAAAWQSPPVKRWMHPEPATPAIAGDVSDEYLKAKDLLQRSYLDANLAAAVTGFQHILDKDPNNALAESGLGAAYFAQYRGSSVPKLLDQAKGAVAKALELDPNLAPAYATRAHMEAMAGHTDLALQQARRAIGLEPRSPEAHAALAMVFDAQGKDKEAIDAAQQAIDLAPEDSMLLVAQGNYYLNNSNARQAADDWQRAINLDPRNVSALFDLGIVEMRMDKLDDARGNFEKVLKIEPDADSYETLGTIALLEGKYAEAIEMDKKAISFNNQSHTAWGNLASAYTWSGDREQAAASYRKAIVLAQAESATAPGETTLIAQLADYYASIGDAAHSLPLIRKVLALAPDDPQILYVAGESYELLSQRGKAIPLIARALAQGYQASQFQHSPELASLRNDPTFQAALTKAKSENAVDSAR